MAPSDPSSSRTRIFVMLALVVAGEAIFGLPFIVARIFRPTLLDVFGITNLQLGAAFSVYGIVALISYFFGGPLADRFSARRLMCAALLTTGAGGVVFAQVQDLGTLQLLYGFWGVTTILLFWAAMIRATREWGGEDEQGRAFGLLDGGRGLFAAVLASATVALFASLLPGDPATATDAQRAAALGQVIWVFTVMNAAAAVLVWFCVPEPEAPPEQQDGDEFDWSQVGEVLRNRAVWLQGLIVIAAYVGFKGTDDLGLYARDVFGYDDVEAAQLGTIAFWVRPFSAIGAGLLGDRLGATRTIVAGFGLMVVGHGVMALGILQPSMTWALTMTVLVTCVGVYGIRGLYFAIFEDADVSSEVTGTAVGVVSIVGYTPDIFMGPWMGWLTDTFPGALGHQYLYASLSAAAAVGIVCTLLFQRLATARSD
jgi:nitrate/nitrite transporter NarK